MELQISASVLQVLATIMGLWDLVFTYHWPNDLTLVREQETN